MNKKYKIASRPLITGGFSDIYEGFDLDNPMQPKRLIIKKLKYTDSESVSRFQQEYEIQNRLEHKNVLKAYDYIETHFEHYIVLEYIYGLDLQTFNLNIHKYLPDILINTDEFNQPMTVSSCLYIFNEILQGLKFAHQNNVVHRDLKPSNILISYDFKKIKIADFGIAKINDNLKFLTQTNTFLGTPLYFSPEHLESIKSVDEKSDVFCLGLLMYFLFTRSHALDFNTTLREQSLMRGNLPDLNDLSIPKSLKCLYLSLVDQDKFKRASLVDVEHEIKKYKIEPIYLSENKLLKKVKSSYKLTSLQLEEVVNLIESTENFSKRRDKFIEVFDGPNFLEKKLAYIEQYVGFYNSNMPRVDFYFVYEILKSLDTSISVDFFKHILSILPQVPTSLIEELHVNSLNGIGQNWCLIPEGEFIYGEKLSEINLPNFLIGKYPVSNRIYQMFDSTHKPNLFSNQFNESDLLNHPVVDVSWYEAMSFCLWLSQVDEFKKITLPNQIQWEKAASWNETKKEKYLFPWGNNFEYDLDFIKDYFNWNINSHTTSVDKFPMGKSSYGVFDMLGNVWEWTIDSNQEDLKLNVKETRKFNCGAGWYIDVSIIPTIYIRGCDYPSSHFSHCGFRLVMNI